MFSLFKKIYKGIPINQHNVQELFILHSLNMSNPITSRIRSHFVKRPYRPSRTQVATRAQVRIIRQCKDCVYYSEADDTCKVLSVVNHISMDVTKVKSLHCRTREDLCGMDARYYEPREVEAYLLTSSVKSSSSTAQSHFTDDVYVDVDVNVDVDINKFSITYYIDGSVCVNTDDQSVDNYYDTLHRDFNDVY